MTPRTPLSPSLPPTEPGALRPAWQLGAVTAAGRSVSLGLQLAHFALLARSFGAERFGAFAAGMAVAIVAGVVAELGLPQTAVLARASRDRATVWSSALWATAATSGAAVLLGGAFAVTVLDGPAERAALGLLGWAGVSRFRLVAVALRQADYDVLRPVASDLAFRLTALAGAVAAAEVAAADGSFATMVGVTAAGLIAGEVLGLTIAWPGRPARRDHGQVEALLDDSRALGATAITWSLQARLDQVLLGSFQVAQGGPYAVAYRLIDASMAVVGAALAMALPILSRTQNGDRERVGRALVAGVALFAAVVSAAVFSGAPLVVSLIGGSGYADAVPLVRILAVVLFLAVVKMPLLHLVIVEQATPLLLRASLGFLTLNVALNLALIPTRGARGAAVATLATEATALIVLALIVRSRLPGFIQGLRPWADLALLARHPTALVSEPSSPTPTARPDSRS